MDGLNAGRRSSLQAAAMEVRQLIVGGDFVNKGGRRFHVFLQNQTTSLLVMRVLAQIQTPLLDFGLKLLPKPAFL